MSLSGRVHSQIEDIDTFIRALSQIHTITPVPTKFYVFIATGLHDFKHVSVRAVVRGSQNIRVSFFPVCNKCYNWGIDKSIIHEL